MQCLTFSPCFRLLQARPRDWKSQPVPGTHLITGGFGSLGLLVAAYLAESLAGATTNAGNRLVLLGRSGRAEGRSLPLALVQLLGNHDGLSITLSRCDVSSREETSALMHAINKVRHHVATRALIDKSSMSTDPVLEEDLHAWL